MSDADTAASAGESQPRALDPSGPVQGEVERGMASMIEQHTQWLEFCAAGQKGEEFDWRTAELLSCLRAIEWDLQDLEDAVSIIEGNRARYAALDDAAIASKKHFLEAMRSKIDGVRSSIENAPASSDNGHAKTKKQAALPTTAASKGYGKLKEEASSGGAYRSGGEPSPTTAESASMSAFGSSTSTAAAGMDRTTSADDRGRRRGRCWWAWCC